MTLSIAELDARFGIPGRLAFTGGPDGLVLAQVTGAAAAATVSLSGGHVMTWAPAGQRPVLWLSGYARFAPGKSIRGGVPVCWPWFGPHETEPTLPSHGFARTSPWSVKAAEALGGDQVRLVLALEPDQAARGAWPQPATLTSVITVGRELSIDLVTRNPGPEPCVIGEALHTYFAVSDIRRTAIHGLDGCVYVDKVEGGRRTRQEGPVVIASEVDRVYLGTTAECVVEDPDWERRIRIAKAGSRSTVVWNPWVAKAQKMGDFGPDGHLGMVCVESGNALDDVVTVPPGGEHTLSVRYGVEALA